MAAIGTLKWKFDSDPRHPARPGLAYWSSPEAKPENSRRRYELPLPHSTPTRASRWRRSAITEELIARESRPAIRNGVDRSHQPVVVYKDLLIPAARNRETLPAPPGDIRAYDARTGKCAGVFTPFTPWRILL